jgi:quercetin dioxygenase-like cupin family protein
MDKPARHTFVSPMISPSLLIHRPAGTGPAYSAVGDRYVMLATGAETAGAYCLSEATVPPGGGPPPHYHTREEESFYVLEGEITFTVNGDTITAATGAFLQVPRNTPHAFKNNSSRTARMLILCVPAGFDRFMAEFATALPSPDSEPLPPSPGEIEKLLLAAPKYGIVLLPPPN